MIKNSVLVGLFVVSFFIAGLAGAPGLPASAAGLRDIQGHWAASDIGKAVAAGYVKGYPDGTFRPNAGVTRAELVIMLNRALGVASGQDARSFKDVRSKDWFAADVEAALAAGYVNGYSDGAFQPQKSVNRQEASCMLAQLLKLDGDAGLKFNDAAKIADWAKTSVGRLVSQEIMAGYPGGAFQPLRVISRAEAVVVINRALAARAPDPVSVQLKVADELVNVRLGPSQLNPVIGKVRSGEILQATGHNKDNWYQILYQGTDGWIAGWCVQEVQDQTPAPAPTPAPTPTPDPAPAPTPQPDYHPGTLDVQVSQDDSGITVDIAGANGGSYTWTDGKNPQRMVVAVPGVTAVRSAPEIDVGKGGIDRIITTLPGSSSGGAKVEIDFTAQEAPWAYKAVLAAPSDLRVTVPPQIYKVQAEADGDSLEVDLWATAPLTYQSSHLSGPPPRRIFDFSGFYLSPALNGWQKQVNNFSIAGLRLGQYLPGTVRLVVETSGPATSRVASSSDGRQITLRFKKVEVSGSVVVIDPGHGGADSGAIGPHGVMEKNVNLAIALKVADLLQQQKVKVTMTRRTDTSVDLAARPKLADDLSADLFVSIHANSTDKNPSMGGTGSYTYAPAGTPLWQMRDERLRLARDLQDEACASLGLRNAGVFEENFEVLRETNMPAALVEVAFISNTKEEKLLSDPGFQQMAAAGIARGIIDYLGGS